MAWPFRKPHLQAYYIAYKRLVSNLQPHIYSPVENTPGLWTHSNLPTTFILAVGNIGIKLFADNDSTHLLNTLQEH